MRAHSFLWAPLLLLSSSAALADTIQTFTVQGTYGDTARSGSYGATLTLDTTLGTVLSATYSISGLGPGTLTPTSIDVSAPDPFTSIDLISIGNQPTFYYALDLYLPVSTLVGYNGGLVCALNNASACGEDNSGVIFLEHSTDALTGTVTPQPTPPVNAVPEPSTLLLLGSGTLAAAGAVRRRLQA